MAYTLTSHIEIGSQIKIDFVTDVTIDKSWKNLSDTAEIKLPRNIRIVGTPDGIHKYIKQGDPVVIQLGYDGHLNEEFRGYVSRIKPTIPITIYCEDMMYQLKRVSVTKSFQAATLGELIQYLVGKYHEDTTRPRIEYQVQDTSTVGAFVFQEATIAQCLQVIKDTTGFVSYFIGSTLYTGFPFKLNQTPNREIYRFQANVVSNELEYRLTEDIKVKVNAVSNQKNGQKLQVTLGDADGENRSLNYYNADLATLTEAATKEITTLKKTGYKGTLTAFGIPIVQHGDIAKIQDSDFPEREGEYFIDRVKINFNDNGFRRIIEPGYTALQV